MLTTHATPGAPTAPAAAVEPGLTDGEVRARRAAGQGNNARLATTRSYLQILHAQAFSFINTVLFAIGIGLVLLGRPDDALLTAGMVLLNVIVGVSQETRAKIQLDRIALLTRPRATVVRDGRERTVDPAELVLGDVLVIGPGDQIVLDGTWLGPARLDVDESLLTGESDRVPKAPGDPVYSGSFAVAGRGRYRVLKVGTASLATELTRGARAFRQVKTPLQRDVDYVVRILVLLVMLLGGLLGLSYVVSPVPVVESVQVAAVLVTLVPQGLFAMITVTYAMGALRMAGKGALIQHINAVESLSNVTVLCLDKTGTLTTNTLTVADIVPLTGTAEALARQLGAFVCGLSAGNRTTEALAAALPGQAYPVASEVYFDSAHKWSGTASADPERPGTYVLGAPEILARALRPDSDLGSLPMRWATEGLRVLLFAYRPETVALQTDDGAPRLPDALIPLGLISLRDELRPEAQATLRSFAEAGVALKIISGDHPDTVAAVARQAGLLGPVRAVSGLDLATAGEAAFARAALEANVFGRITPQQKEQLVRCLQAAGHYVAMIGDGVNDVLSLKRAQLAIAMQSGSTATRSVADIVLLDDSFAILPIALREGRRIISGMQDIMRLVLTHTLYITLIIVAAAIVDVAFPTTPKLRSLITLLSVGIPTLGIATWARPDPAPGRVIHAVTGFVLPAALSVSAAAFGVYLAYILTTGDAALAQSALTTVALLCGLVLVLFVEPPLPAFVAGDALSGDWRPTLVALGMLGLYGLAFLVPPIRDFYMLTPLPLLDWPVLGGVVAIWAVALRWAWRHRLGRAPVQPGPRLSRKRGGPEHGLRAAGRDVPTPGSGAAASATASAAARSRVCRCGRAARPGRCPAGW